MAPAWAHSHGHCPQSSLLQLSLSSTATCAPLSHSAFWLLLRCCQLLEAPTCLHSGSLINTLLLVFFFRGKVFATMHALRLRKGIVPGRDKVREARRLQQVTRQRGARGSILQDLRSFLTVDSFMYGPLMESPTVVHIRDGSEPHTLDREQENDGLDDGSTREDTNGVEENDANSGKNIENGHDESAITRYQAGSRSKTILSVQRTSVRTTSQTALPPPADGSRTPSSTVWVMKLSRNGT